MLSWVVGNTYVKIHLVIHLRFEYFTVRNVDTTPQCFYKGEFPLIKSYHVDGEG